MLRPRLTEALKEAMRAKDQATVSTVRMILAALKDRDIAARPSGVTDGIDDAGILSLLQSMIKQRQESVALYQQGGRADLVEKEQGEIAVIERFLPTQLGEEEVGAAIAATIADLGAGSIKDMGRVMAELRARHSGQMDFTRASALVKERLSAAS